MRMITVDRVWFDNVVDLIELTLDEISTQDSPSGYTMWYGHPSRSGVTVEYAIDYRVGDEIIRAERIVKCGSMDYLYPAVPI